MTIDLVLKGIDYIIKLLERREKRAKDRQEKIFAPLFADLCSIDQNYNQLFLSIQQLFPFDIEPPTANTQAQVRAACEKIREMRVAFASTRQRISAVASELQLMDELSQAERDFLQAVVDYLPCGELRLHAEAHANASDMTRATLLLDLLYENLEEQNTRQVVDRTVAINNKLWREVCRAYSTLSYAAAG
ncbi:hypothetical protein H3H36_18680 [Duganella sp. FT3S]|uniref:Uncharacterized protein n=1 Tax=Rugamonas fusca TaxID=2758568 RepID=A0A7W2I8B9_9BURK|nr:hypothetical protein [Rugamonas fusca]MBA5607386.1 hypothetical protein [Rugamonas fusca]